MHRRLGAAFAVLAAVAPVVPASAAEEVDRGLIVFSRDCEMYGVDPVTSVERKLTSTDTCGPHGVAHRHPSWTPDGAQLV
ncbi:MAG TPA: hypothetical protein VLD62_12100, partial [Acidimicrobiia bacterium]|nr:hypothetical protein [Acidimicrobiia bacterium]